MPSFLVKERNVTWTDSGAKCVDERSHEIAMEDVSSIQTLWGGVIFYIKDRVLVLYPNGTAHMGYLQSNHGTRTFVCDGIGRVAEPLPVMALAHKLWPNARVADESVFYQEPREINMNPVCKYRAAWK